MVLAVTVSDESGTGRTRNTSRIRDVGVVGDADEAEKVEAEVVLLGQEVEVEWKGVN